ncbi:ligase-associated DNA damage response endonuclease PdeM [uncultured Litoreibacter sp.]|uniref:ligase-associated DNA damage response endonuclease PdeM n=1 Tax=uncultured Litoreibacter sp. TaxID=1392394 RepID=UPI00262A9C38|nr:ligase-associated DNA damage response endonuclease PdeM [uncultured Litoreibacter sp.]
MNIHPFTFCGASLQAIGSGALFWPDEGLLVVSDLHLGKSERMARRSRQLLPPYETIDTLTRLEDALTQTNATTVICLGDSFDDLAAGRSLPEDQVLWLTRLMAGRSWIWIEGNHDPGPLEFGGSHLAQYQRGPLLFRHIAQADADGEVSGHYHPKSSVMIRGRMVTRPSFLVDDCRMIMPAFGTYTGGLRSTADGLSSLMGTGAYAIMTGPRPCAVPMPR